MFSFLSASIAFAPHADGCACTGTNEGLSGDFGPMYGTSCAAWDETQAVCLPGGKYFHEGSAARFCTKSWCYVDEDCTDAAPSVFLAGSGLYFSYGACGGVDIFSEIASYDFDNDGFLCWDEQVDIVGEFVADLIAGQAQMSPSELIESFHEIETAGEIPPSSSGAIAYLAKIFQMAAEVNGGYLTEESLREYYLTHGFMAALREDPDGCFSFDQATDAWVDYYRR
mmetsp:Transcript_8669/g.27759  ORF Transcript_8669/g.27759 Transcript_8669/m.27759 type:complete len:226 (-) Transcript_8669:164-841(-)